MADPNDPLDVGASMPGKVLSILRQVGDRVEAGGAMTVLVLEAMKMETAVTASTGGVIEKLTVSVGDDAKAGELLVRLRALLRLDLLSRRSPLLVRQAFGGIQNDLCTNIDIR